MDDHLLCLLSESTREGLQTLQIFDTERGTIVNPIQTTFYFPPDCAAYGGCLHLDPCSHIPSPYELASALFFPDPSQRVLSVLANSYHGLCAINTELLLRLAREWEGQNFEWEKWSPHTTWVPFPQGHVQYICVSGCRLLFIETDKDGSVGEHGRTSGPLYLRLYDFSQGGRAKHPPAQDVTDAGRGLRWLSPSSKRPLHLDNRDVRDLTLGHDSIVFRTVSIFILLATYSQLKASFLFAVPHSAECTRRRGST